MAKTKRTPKPPPPETYEEFLALAMEDFAHKRKDTGIIPDANYPFTVGQEVRYGHVPGPCIVEGVLDQGRVIHFSHPDRDPHPKDNGELRWDRPRRLPRLAWWYDLEPIREKLPTKLATQHKQFTYMQTDLDGLIFTVRSRGIIDSPDYQRGYVWTLEDKQRLIHSIFNRSDIGKFVFLEHTSGDNWKLEVIDGKQRLNAIREFMEGRFLYEGYSFFNLSDEDRRAFSRLVVQFAYVKPETVKRSDILHLFLSINAAGVPQTEEHIAKAKELYKQAIAEEAAHEAQSITPTD